MQADSPARTRWSRLRPVGEPISARAGDGDPFSSWPSLAATYVDSGTSALAIAIKCAAENRACAKPEVILPGYGCPDLVAACLWAGVTPVLVDLEVNQPWMDLRAVAAACGAATVGIVAVNFLGIRERLAALQAIASDAGCALIEDCAQWFPARGADLPAEFTIASFGKGKPVSLLGGGVLLAPRQQAVPALEAGTASAFGLRAKVHVYNLLLKPSLYPVLTRLFAGTIGQTKYHALERVSGMDPIRGRWTPRNIDEYWSRESAAVHWLAAALAPLVRHGLVDLARMPGAGKLLRYPLLLPTVRDADVAEQRLLECGLGASRLYRRVLPEIESVPSGTLRVPAALSRAEDFAGRLLTLPVHSDVRRADVTAMSSALAEVLARSVH